MVKKSPTLHLAEDFFRIYRRGRKWIGQSLIIYYLSTNKTQIRRLAVVISKKVDSRATARNLCRRRIQGALRKLILPVSGYDLVIVVKKGAVSFTEDFFKKDLEIGLSKVFRSR
ncbi:MAG: ribonuclease P protein component [Patescibacteria group bacterium]